MRNKQKKAFTLIELMIVITIIWVLAVTLIPQLQWAQARSRDAGRISSITAIEAVLITYFSDEWQYPTNASGHASSTDATTNWNWCLSQADWSVISGLEWLFKWRKAPLDTNRSNTTATCSTKWAFAYYAIEKDWIENNSYLLIANVESYQKANLTLAWVSASNLPKLDSTTDYSTVEWYSWWKLSTEADTANLSVFWTFE